MPEPCKLVLLDEVNTVPSGTKVRFLGCVHEYNARKANLLLRERHPATSSTVQSVLVNVQTVLENADHSLLEVGAWVNIIGYLRRSAMDSKEKTVSKRGDESAPPAIVDAVMLWSAGAIKLDQYKSAARDYQKAVRSR